MVEKHESYELTSILYKIADEGYAVVGLRRLFRLLGTGNKAAKTWRLLLDAWEEIGRDANDLHVAEIDNGFILLMNRKSDTVKSWAGW